VSLIFLIVGEGVLIRHLELPVDAFIMIAVASLDVVTDFNYILTTVFASDLLAVFTVLFALLPMAHFAYFITFRRPVGPPREIFPLHSLVRHVCSNRFPPYRKVGLGALRHLGDIDNLFKLIIAGVAIAVVGIYRLALFLISSLVVFPYMVPWIACHTVAFLLWFLVGTLLCQLKFMACVQVQGFWYSVWRPRPPPSAVASVVSYEDDREEKKETMSARDCNEMMIAQAVLESFPQLLVQGTNALRTRAFLTSAFSRWSTGLTILMSSLITLNVVYFYGYHIFYKKSTLDKLPVKKMELSPSSWMRNFRFARTTTAHQLQAPLVVPGGDDSNDDE
jgi:hypothetical protein